MPARQVDYTPSEKYSQLLKPEAKDCPTRYVRDTVWLLRGYIFLYTRRPLLDCERHSLTALRFIRLYPQTPPGLWETQSDWSEVYTFIPADPSWTVRDTVWLIWGLYSWPLLPGLWETQSDWPEVYTRRPLLDCERHSLTDLRFIVVTSAAWAVRDTVWLLWGLYM